VYKIRETNGEYDMGLGELLANIEALGLGADTEIVISTDTGTFSDFTIEVCTHEHSTGDVIDGPDCGGWGGPEWDPRPLPQPVLSFTVDTKQRAPITF
jgi:hypothetical protein